jgi:hypothetical protein
LNELRLALNLLKTKNTIHELQVCDYHHENVCGHDGQQCQASSVVYQGIIQLWEAMVCPKDEYEEWHDCTCLFGNYPIGGVEKLALCFKEVTRSLNDVMQWHQFALETTMARNGQTLKKLTLVYKTTTTNEFINYLKLKLQHFVKQNFVV